MKRPPIVFPKAKLTPKERAYQMWAASPNDLDYMAYESRQAFYEAHIQSAIRQAFEEHTTEPT